jgi:hypothetical protein
LTAVFKPGGSCSNDPPGFFLEFQPKLAIIGKKPQVIYYSKSTEEQDFGSAIFSAISAFSVLKYYKKHSVWAG